MTKRLGLTLVEVLVAIAILAVLGVALVSVLPGLSRNTRASTVDSIQLQQILTVFERISSDWTNQTAYVAERLNTGESVADFTVAETGGACTAAVTQPTAERKRVTITCEQADGLPARTLRAEFGEPGETE
jgi:prepilin-type N-terminal cleavage/methylation domain-containing protein